MKQYLIKKYEAYLSNLEWDLKNHKTHYEVWHIKSLEARIEDYREVLIDLKMLPDL